jgi:hypothetical protein
MANEIVATVTSDDDVVVSVQTTANNTAVSDLYNPLYVPQLGGIGDVDTSQLTNGSVLVYKTNTNKWTSTINLDAQDMDGGEF